MSKSARIGGVTVTFNDDGTLFVYQPDSSRVMSMELAVELTRHLLANVDMSNGSGADPGPVSWTVPAGVISTSDGPDYTDPEVLGPAVAAEVAEAQAEKPAPRRRGRPRKTAG